MAPWQLRNPTVSGGEYWTAVSPPLSARMPWPGARQTIVHTVSSHGLIPITRSLARVWLDYCSRTADAWQPDSKIFPSSSHVGVYSSQWGNISVPLVIRTGCDVVCNPNPGAKE